MKKFWRHSLTLLRSIAVVPIIIYQKLISPLFPRSCRYHPSCSQYSRDAIMKFGLFRGGLLGLARIFRCWGWFSGGSDPVPEMRPLSHILPGYRKFYSGPGSRQDDVPTNREEE